MRDCKICVSCYRNFAQVCNCNLQVCYVAFDNIKYGLIRIWKHGIFHININILFIYFTHIIYYLKLYIGKKLILIHFEIHIPTWKKKPFSKACIGRIPALNGLYKSREGTPMHGLAGCACQCVPLFKPPFPRWPPFYFAGPS